MESLTSILSESKSAIDELRGETATVDREPSDESPRDASVEAKADEAPEKGAESDEDDGDFDPSDLRVEGLRKAINSERSRARQYRKELKEAQARLREIEAHQHQLSGQTAALQQMATRAAPKEQPKPEDEFDKFLSQGPQYVRGLLEEQVSSLRREAIVQRIDDAEADIMERHEDAAENLAHFKQLMASNPALVAEFRAIAERKHPHYRNPAKFAYEYAKAHRTAAEIGDPVEYEKRLRAKWEAEQRGNGDGEPRGTVTRLAQKTLAGTRGGGAGVTRDWSGPTPLKELFG